MADRTIEAVVRIRFSAEERTPKSQLSQLIKTAINTSAIPLRLEEILEIK